MPAYAPLLWEHLSALVVREAAEDRTVLKDQGTSAGVNSPAAHAQAACLALAACGGEAFVAAVTKAQQGAERTALSSLISDVCSVLHGHDDLYGLC